MNLKATERIALPPRRKIVLRTISDAIADVESLHFHGYQPLGRWNLAQACTHLTISMRWSMEGWPAKPMWPIIIPFGAVLRWNFLRTRYIPRGFPTHPDAAPAPGGDETVAVELLRQMFERLSDHDGPFHPHPFFGQFKTKQQWIDYHLIHASHHLSFLRPKI